MAYMMEQVGQQLANGGDAISSGVQLAQAAEGLVLKQKQAEAMQMELASKKFDSSWKLITNIPKVGEKYRGSYAEQAKKQLEQFGMGHLNNFVDMAAKSPELSNKIALLASHPGLAKLTGSNSAQDNLMQLNKLADSSLDPESALDQVIAEADKVYKVSSEEKQLQMKLSAAKEMGESKQETKLTAGQEQLDKETAKDIASWNRIDRNKANTNLQLLKSSIEELKKMPEATGGTIQANSPMWARRKFFPKLVEIEQRVQKAAVEGLRASLGSQFTEKEGERILNMSWDPGLPLNANLTKIQNAITEISTNVKNRESASKWFKEHKGTMAGYEEASSTEQSTAAVPSDGVKKAEAAIDKYVASAVHRGKFTPEEVLNQAKQVYGLSEQELAELSKYMEKANTKAAGM